MTLSCWSDGIEARRHGAWQKVIESSYRRGNIASSGAWNVSTLDYRSTPAGRLENVAESHVACWMPWSDVNSEHGWSVGEQQESQTGKGRVRRVELPSAIRLKSRNQRCEDVFLGEACHEEIS